MEAMRERRTTHMKAQISKQVSSLNKKSVSVCGICDDGAIDL